MTSLEAGQLDADTPAGRIRSLVAKAESGVADFGPVQAVAAASTSDVAHFLHAHFGDPSGLELLGTGVAASPGAASGRIALSAEAALEAADRGEQVILVRAETGPEDVLGMQAAAGILTARGGLASHAAVVARGWGIPAVVGLGPLVIDGDSIAIGDTQLVEGDAISIDGHTGQVFGGASSVSTDTVPPELDRLLAWADALRSGRFGVRANADDRATARHARTLGADGIGLCRTEHMFLAEDRLPLVRRLILSDDPKVDSEALAALEEAQQQDFEELLEAMDGLPVTVRLLDPPLHEFLPPLEPLVVDEALGRLDAEGVTELAAVRRMHEVNPMIGTRGVRLGMVKPGLYPMQVRAVTKAVESLQERGLDPRVEIMIPLVVDPAELRMARSWVEQAEEEAGATGANRRAMSVGTMIETPRAALLADELAGIADFFSFGTNDLTQLTYAFSRDDVGAELLPRYIERGILANDPFEVLDQAGVGFLVRHAIEGARSTNPSIKIGACGEQAGDPESARFLVASGLDYVSCSPYRLPAVRLAVAQALIELGLTGPEALVRTGTEAVPQPQGAAPVAAPAPPDEPSPGPEAVAEVSAPADGLFRLLHAMKIKGFASTELLVEMTGLDPTWTEEQLDILLRSDLAKFHEARSFWQLLPAGKERHSASLPGVDADRLDDLRKAYHPFLELNLAFKELCISWQMRNGEPNDHSDPAYDRSLIEQLAAHHSTSSPVLADFAAAVERLGLYEKRLEDALERVQGGEASAFTGVMKRSYHDVWMELHEDLILVLGIDRTAEGSF